MADGINLDEALAKDNVSSRVESHVNARPPPADSDTLHSKQQGSSRRQRSKSTVDTTMLQKRFNSLLGTADVAEREQLGVRLARRLKRGKLYPEAQAVLQQIMNEQEAAGIGNTADSADTITALAGVLELQGQYAASLELYQRAVVIQEQELGLEHATTTKTALQLGALQSHRDSYLQRALESFQESLQLKIEAVGELHPSTAATLSSMGEVLCQQGAFPQAFECIRRCLRIRVKNPKIGPQHSLTANVVSQLAHAYRLDGDFAQALEYMCWALRIRTATLGPHARATADTHFNVALLHRRLGEHATSAREFRKAATALIELHGPEHKDSKEALSQALQADELKSQSSRRLSTFESQEAMMVDDSHV